MTENLVKININSFIEHIVNADDRTKINLKLT